MQAAGVEFEPPRTSRGKVWGSGLETDVDRGLTRSGTGRALDVVRQREAAPGRFEGPPLRKLAPRGALRRAILSLQLLVRRDRPLVSLPCLNGLAKRSLHSHLQLPS